MSSRELTRRQMIAALSAIPGAMAFPTVSSAQGRGGGAPRAAAAPGVAPDPQVISDLVAANHILVRKGIIEVQGHISVRHDRDPKRYFLARGISPEIVNTADIMEFDLDSNAIDPTKGQPYLERFIHGEIFKARPEIMSVVHAHTRSVLPFATSDIPLRPVYQLATFLVDTVPVFKNGDNGEVISNAQQGAALTQALGKRGAILLHGHGFVVVGASIQQAVDRCIQLDINAQVLHEILAMGGKPVYLKPSPDAAAGRGGNARGWEAWMREETSR
ncbi:MAG: class II aldolase/adducin family protein [Acidobacteria bacterium]|nr:class II aldolase/adducin family protein [Acidobacteriota bacterium]